MRGVLICGGTGSRLKPLTDITNKSLLPIYDKPLILYPLQKLLDADIHHIAVVTSTEHIDQMTSFLGSGERFGCEFSYRVQEKPGGIAQALGIAEDFTQDESICALLGDNVYFDDLAPAIRSFTKGGHVFLKEVPDPERFGIATLRRAQGDTAHVRVESIEEKPKHNKSNLAITGCYLYDARCFDIIRNLKPSARGELEITDISRWYLDHRELTASILEEEWIDAGTFESLFTAASLVRERSWAAQAPRKSPHTSPQSPTNRTAGHVPLPRRKVSPATPDL